MKISFLGAAETVTGSKYLVQNDKAKVLVDCGLFQGYKELRQRNWDPLPVSPASLDAVVLTHAHIDHTGYLPLLVKNGFRKKIYCTQGTYDLCKILLPDSGHIQEEDAEYANRKGFSRHKPALPLFTVEDAQEALKYFEVIPYDKTFYPGEGIDGRLTQSGHILGAAFVRLTDKSNSIVFSGDLGRPNDAIMMPPRWIKESDYLVLESTYGGRTHPVDDVLDQLEAVVNRTMKRGGVLIIPAFSVGRSQSILFALYQLKRTGRISNVPVHLNSPMSIAATDILIKHEPEHRLSQSQSEGIGTLAHYVRTAQESRKLADEIGPAIIISASGMLTGGRVLYHLRTFGPFEKNTILLTGFQAQGTRGAQLIAGEREIKVHGEIVSIKAEVAEIKNLSAHADHDEILAWLSHFEEAPKKVFITHGEKSGAEKLKEAIEERFSWTCEIPTYLQEFDLT